MLLRNGLLASALVSVVATTSSSHPNKSYHDQANRGYASFSRCLEDSICKKTPERIGANFCKKNHVELVEKIMKSYVVVMADDHFGAGTIIKVSPKSTFIITAFHLVKDAQIIRVKKSNEEGLDEIKIKANKIYRAPNNIDLAIIEIYDNLGPAVELADKLPKRGLDVWVTGTPLGSESKITKGIVSGFEQEETDIDRFRFTSIISDAPGVNPGNSGGGLFNDEGKLLGVVVQIPRINRFQFGRGMSIIVPITLLNTFPKIIWEEYKVEQKTDKKNNQGNSYKRTPFFKDPRNFQEYFDKMDQSPDTEKDSNDLTPLIPKKHFFD